MRLTVGVKILLGFGMTLVILVVVSLATIPLMIITKGGA